ncbi:ABC transporter permease subunit [Candidatus Pelagibacter bacterium]|nr:ABC transporter permease subunit [Candidatus Pelagibacter bacterium]MDA8772749.1 ABC transporter permease subunit [Candidatus Pelagibacter bacterium]
MITGFLTFVFFFAIVGCILYGRKLIKTEKVDAVFGNPERAQGGLHWVIVGSSFLLLVWLYYSWDMAKSFFPKSANELCQVGKIDESLLSLKYLFPIEERQLKSTSVIETETKNLNKIILLIEKSNDVENENKNKLLDFVDQTKKSIPLLTNENLLESETKEQINSITKKINNLANDFVKKNYPYEKPEDETNRIELAKQEGNWGASSTSLDNAVEIPSIPKTKKGLKFQAAAEELNLISDEFFELRNHNAQYATALENLKNEIKEFRSQFNDSNEITSSFAKDILKIARRIEYASIFPPQTLIEMQASIVNFDNLQKKEQGGLKWVDFFLFPSGTIMSSGPSCTEQGSGRWLPKPSDTLNKFALMLNPNVGFKQIPLIWYEMMDVGKVVGFILPDWIADILPGEYPVHNEKGEIKPNFKSKVLNVVTGNFELFKIPIPTGHIWDSFLRVFLGLVTGIIVGVPLGLYMGLNRFAKGFFDPLIELYRPVPPLAWAPLVISVLGIDNFGKVFLLFMVSLSIMIISARAGASGTQLSKIHAAHSLGASKWQILRYVIFPNSLPEILTGIRVATGMCWGTLVAAEFLAGTTGVGFVENVAKKYFQYEVIWITIFIMGMLGLLFDITIRKIIDKTIPWRGKG